ncbi:fungal protein [Schizosaccharomyces japonicus yFS275]|uniref:Small ribosomal subunit protein mS41 n=1 Tax=Schizosaccharomyces japonicus (strain yFS275 / FY16936) TaxID=402676 RepID=B6JUT5_SCHJY|nr:fungal protein [Schizosaccharomyces japonicus yFS275]EEB05066.1 fungal protein [Schizosaccharomyces japonicus yFS275]
MSSNNVIKTIWRSLNVRMLHTKTQIPPPRPDIKNVQQFLRRIGRNVHDKVNDKIDTWEKLFSMTTGEMKTVGIDARTRRYIARQRQNYRLGYEIRAYPKHATSKKDTSGN